MNNRRTTLLDTLTDIANNPENEYDKIIAKNKRYLLLLPERHLSSIYWTRVKACKLCNMIPYSRKDIRSLVENDNIDPFNYVAELENTFTTLEYIFSKVNGEDF